jgi:hypothetical protein
MPADDGTAGSPRLRRMMELARWHDEWAARHAGDAEFRPDAHPGPDSDYNVHNVDVDPSAEAEREFMAGARRIMGLDPVTGMRPAPPEDGETDDGESDER